MKTSFPKAYGPGMNVLVPPDTIQTDRSKAGGKAKARYPNTPLSPSTSNGTAGKAKVHALTPGTSPTGS